MKNLITTLAVTTLVSTSAFAAPTPAAKKAAAKTNKATATAKAAPVVAPTENIAAPAVVTPASGGQSSVAAPTAPAAAATKKFTGKVTDRAAFKMNDANRASEATQADGAMDPRLGYSLSESTSVGLGTTILHSFGATDSGKTGWTVTDIFGQVQNSNAATVLGNKLKAGGRLYVPSSEASQAAGQVGRVRADLTVERAIGPVTVSYYAAPQYYFQRNATYKNAEGKIEGTRNFRLFHYLGVSGELAPKLSAYSQIGLDQGWFNSDEQQIEKNARTSAKIYTETAVEYAFNSNVSVAVGVGQVDPDMLAQAPNQQGPLYRDEVTSYFLEGTVSF